MRTAARLAPADPQSLLLAAGYFLRAGDEAPALTTLRRALDSSPAKSATACLARVHRRARYRTPPEILRRHGAGKSVVVAGLLPLRLRARRHVRARCRRSSPCASRPKWRPATKGAA